MTDPGHAIEEDGRRRRLIIIVVAFSVIVLWLTAQLVGNRLVVDEIDRIRLVASEARVDPADLAFSANATVSFLITETGELQETSGC